MLRRLIAPAFALALLPGTGAASVEDAKAARVMWTAFECGTYARMSGEQERMGALFEVGMAAGRKFYAAVEAGTITDDQQRQHVPLFVSLLSAGPSVDFILGRVFQFASDYASDEVTTKDNSGLPLPMDKWLMDDELIQAKAKWHYQAGNCDLL